MKKLLVLASTFALLVSSNLLLAGIDDIIDDEDLLPKIRLIADPQNGENGQEEEDENGSQNSDSDSDQTENGDDSTTHDEENGSSDDDATPEEE